MSTMQHKIQLRSNSDCLAHTSIFCQAISTAAVLLVTKYRKVFLFYEKVENLQNSGNTKVLF